MIAAPNGRNGPPIGWDLTPVHEKMGAQIKTAPGARCVNNEQGSQGLADWLGVDW